MTHAYDEIYLGKAQKALGDMCHFAVYDMKWELDKFFKVFVSTGVARLVEKGSPGFVVGKSGYELAFEVYYRLTGSECEIRPNYIFGKTPEYFAGWSLAYYSWYRDISFERICSLISMESVVNMYNPYHEMDVMQFVEAMDEKLSKYGSEAILKRLRLYAELTQKQLAERSGVSQRMIEQYEQGRKELRHASADTVKRLAKELGCSMELLLA